MTTFYVHETEENMVNASKIQGRGRGQLEDELEVQKSIVAQKKSRVKFLSTIAEFAQFKEHLAGTPEDPVLSVPIFC